MLVTGRLQFDAAESRKLTPTDVHVCIPQGRNIARNPSGTIVKIPMNLDRPIAFIDLETTGLDVTSDRIVELAVLRIDPDGNVVERSRRFLPGIPISPEATAVHKISNSDVESEEPFNKRAHSLNRLLDGCDLAGFNIRGFDLPLLMTEFRRAGVRFNTKGRRIIDVQQIFHNEEPRSLEAAVKKYLGTEHEGAHGASADVRATASVLIAQLGHYHHLPKDLDGLNTYCDRVGPVRNSWSDWFNESDGGIVFRRGKHRGKTLELVRDQEIGYLTWLLGSGLLDESGKAKLRAAQATSDNSRLGGQAIGE